MNNNYKDPNFSSLLAFAGKDEKYNALKFAIQDLQECYPADLSYYYGKVEGVINVMLDLQLITEEEVYEILSDLYGTNVCEENKEGD